MKYLFACRDNRMEADSQDTHYNLAQFRYGVPLSATDAVGNSPMIPMYSSGISDYLPPRTPLKSDSGVTYNVPTGTRKRSRESPSGLFPYTAAAVGMQRDTAGCGSSFSFLGEDISLQIQQQQLDVDRLIAQHVSFNHRLRLVQFLLQFVVGSVFLIVVRINCRWRR